MAFSVSVGETDFADMMAGYLTKADADEDEETVRLKIPNREIASIFEDAVVRLFQDTIDSSRQKSLMEALWGGDELEAGRTGRPDILLLDHDRRRAIIIEAKRSKSESDMDGDCEAAVEQIMVRRYGEGLYGYTQILCYGIAFFQKQAKVNLVQ